MRIQNKTIIFFSLVWLATSVTLAGGDEPVKIRRATVKCEQLIDIIDDLDKFNSDRLVLLLNQYKNDSEGAQKVFNSIFDLAGHHLLIGEHDKYVDAIKLLLQHELCAKIPCRYLTAVAGYAEQKQKPELKKMIEQKRLGISQQK